MLGASTEAAAALLLYATHGFLGTAGLLMALILAAFALGLWVGAEAASMRPRWISLIVAYTIAGVFAALWSNQGPLQHTAFGGALAALFLLAEPAYTAGAAFAGMQRTSGSAPVFAFAGAALGVLTAAWLLIPRLQPSVIFVGAAAILLVVALLEMRRAPHAMDRTDLSLNGKCAIVTGVGARGQMGYAIARSLIAAGARVCITSLGPDAQSLAGDLGSGVVSVQADLSSEDDAARLVATAREHFGRLDVLVNAAGGLSLIKPIAETSAAEWESEVQRNAETAFLVSRAALPHLRETHGAIVNFAAPAGLRAVATLGAYSAGKAAVIALTRALALEERKNGVRVNAIAPGMIDTEQNRRSVADPAATRWVTREQVASAVVFLASDASSGISGETIHVMGEGIS